jgi:hypothetical protein
MGNDNQNKNVPGHDTQIILAQLKTELAEVRAEQPEARTEQVETRTELAKTRSEQAVRASEMSYRRLFEAAKDGSKISDENPPIRCFHK